MKQELFTIKKNIPLNETVYLMELEGDTLSLTRPGQFVNIQIDGCYLRRPISVADYKEGEMMLIYRVVGRGTEAMRQMPVGKALDILMGLGNGYDVEPAGNRPLLVGGGVGVPPLYGLCRRLIDNGATVQAVLGFRTAADAFFADEFRALGADVTVTTEDGSLGLCGFATKGMQSVAEKGGYTYLYSCGPEPMLRAVHGAAITNGQYSFEERMGCGFGACMGCSCKTKYGSKRICKDGPVLYGEEIVW